MKTLQIRGLPQAVQQDACWLNSSPPGVQQRDDETHQGGDYRVALLLALIALGDALIWQVMPGLSLAVFGAAIVLSAALVCVPRMSLQSQGHLVAATTLALCPLVELVQPLSLLVSATGVSAILAALAGLKPQELWRGVLRLWPMGVRQTVIDGVGSLQGRDTQDLPALIGGWFMRWIMPLALGGVFVLLLLAANPVAERWLEEASLDGAKLPRLDRMLFWLCLAPVAWTALRLRALRERLRASPRARKMGPRRQGLINPESVSRALVLFNVVFAVQTAMDLVYLYGGLGLPEGITYAEYAHRGAYPLVVTGLLAGGFALLTRRWVQGDAMLRALLMAFVGQNAALVVSSLVRLEMYVEVYGLTHLRMAAAIWMGLTALGLGLILWQVWQGRDNGWLMLRAGGLTATVLYVCCFISFDATIARYNLTREVADDFYYLCQLGDAAKPVIAQHAPKACGVYTLRIRAPQDWREWGFRNWRARTSLAKMTNEARG